MARVKSELMQLGIFYALVIWSCIVLLVPLKLFGASPHMMMNGLYFSAIITSVYFSVNKTPNKIYNYIQKVG